MTRHRPDHDPQARQPADADTPSAPAVAPGLRRPRLGHGLPRHPAFRVGLVAGVLLLLAGGVQWLVRDYNGDRAGTSPSATAPFSDLQWPALVPTGWDPLRPYRNLPLGALDDADPKARALLQQMRETWANAPTNQALDGTRIRILGYVVPLEANKGELREFLLVPYAGACIHTPPPPANQIIHVSLATALKDVRTMDTVRVSGILRTARSDSPMGVSGYRLQALHVEKREVRAW